MSKNLICAALLSVGLALSSAQAATVITFTEAGVSNPSFLSSDGKVKVEWVWSTGLNDGHSHVSGGYEQGHGQAFQGVRLSSVNPLEELNLLSFDLRGTWMVSSLNDGTGISYSMGSAGAGNWATQMVNFSSFNPIYIYANGTSGSGDLDNIVFDANRVPVTGSLALAGLALFGLTATRRRAA